MTGSLLLVALSLTVAVVFALLLSGKKNTAMRRLEGERKLLDARLLGARDEISRLKEELAAQNEQMIRLEKELDGKIDDVVQASIQKISHAEEAKEEAVKAAQDNFEAAAEAHAMIKEKDKEIAALQTRLDEAGDSL